jgi:hypothetical protein
MQIILKTIVLGVEVFNFQLLSIFNVVHRLENSEPEPESGAYIIHYI